MCDRNYRTTGNHRNKLPETTGTAKAKARRSGLSGALSFWAERHQEARQELLDTGIALSRVDALIKRVDYVQLNKVLTHQAPAQAIGETMTLYAGASSNRPIIDNTVTTGERVMVYNTEARRRRLYKWAIGLSVVYIVDGIFMAAALLAGGYAFLGYAQLSYVPVFMPALFAGLVVSGMYVHAFVRRGWTARKAEWLFFFLLVDAVAAKVVVIIHRHCCL